MNIIVIGNGFDIAHNLPTKYTDFLEFVKVIRYILNTKDTNYTDWGKINPQIKKIIIDNTENIRYNLFTQEKIWKNLLDNNFWIEYFLQNDMHGKENWIDFESEISDVIQSLYYDMHENENEFNIYDDIPSVLTNDFLDCYVNDQNMEILKDIKEKLYDDLNKLIKALEIYLVQYVDKIDCEKISPDIEEIINTSNEEKKVLCFNYTNTIEKLYTNNCEIDIDYIHGKVNNNYEIEKNNMVLGIDEFLSPEKQNKNIEFVEFKKFYQRIYKETGCKYKVWVDMIKEEYLLYTKAKMKEAERSGMDIQNMINSIIENTIMNKKSRKHNLYIYGHSLDITDGDIIRDLMLNNNVNTVIFYHNKESMGKQIANLVRVIGEDELIKRTGGNTKTIEFRLQRPMIEQE
ncbi:hypothetical protein DXC84_02810 [Ruminococcus sp. TF08-4]|nr:hypothetical protein DXC84_02810 [Ruminococcus sp. TF08-4]